jgi:predicted kinase
MTFALSAVVPPWCGAAVARPNRNHDEIMLIIFGGLPGIGKTTLAKAAAREREAVYSRVDTIEQALRFSETLQGEDGPAGYLVLVAYRLAEENLRIGRTVVADSVIPLNITRDTWLWWQRIASGCSRNRSHLL